MTYISNIFDIVKVKNGVDGANGKDGVNGQDGAPGADGKNGKDGQTFYTWIAYANAAGVDENGQLIDMVAGSFDLKNSAGKAYMGIATNKTEENESTDPTKYKWSKIQGEQGPAGFDGQQYFIKSNTSEIKRFYEGENSVSFSPDLFYFYVVDRFGVRVKFKGDVGWTDETSVRIELLNNNTDSSYNIVEVPTTVQDIAGNSHKIINYSNIDETSDKYWNFSFSNLLENDPGENENNLGKSFSFIKDKDTVLLLSFLKNKEIISTQAIPVSWALSNEYAKFWLTAQTIQASVDGAGLKFGSDGLTISNSASGGIKIIHTDEYIKSEDTTVVSGKKYFILGANGTYTEVENPTGNPSSEGWYELSEESGSIVFNADTSGNLEITGKINANSGRIGDIDIVSGGLSCPGFSLNSDGIIANSGSLGNLSLNGDLNITNSGSVTSLKSDGLIGFKLDGKTGSIIANDITLGEFVKVSKYLRLDNCWIFNPNSYLPDDPINSQSNWVKNSFINVNYNDEEYELTKDSTIVSGKTYYIKNGESYEKVESPKASDLGKYYELVNSTLRTSVAITTDGKIRLRGDTSNSSSIVLDGKEGAIYSTDPISDSGYWRIDNNSAVFNNIVAKGSIKCAVLEYGKVQAVGGVLLIRTSSSIKRIDRLDDIEDGSLLYYQYNLLVENSSQFIKEEFCQIQDTNSVGSTFIVKIRAIDNSNNIITVQTKKIFDVDLIGAPIISFGGRHYNGSNIIDVPDAPSYGIGLNSSDNDSLLPKRALSLVNFVSTYDNIRYENKIILGYIPNNPGIYGSIANQYGLYADNVLVKGKLVSGTGVDNSKTSGIDTLSTVLAPDVDAFTNKGNIVMWAGATGNDLETAPFWVDSLGNVYASSGYFNGAIIAKSYVESATIRAAVITGTGGEGEHEGYALKIINEHKDNNNISKAIKFYSIYIDGNGIKQENNYFTLTSEALSIGKNTSLQVGESTSITNDGIVSPYFRTFLNEATDSGSIINDTQIGFFNKYLSGFTWNLESNILHLDKDGTHYMNFGNNTITTISNLLVNNGFNLWEKMEFKRIYNENEEIIGFDIEFNEGVKG